MLLAVEGDGAGGGWLSPLDAGRHSPLDGGRARPVERVADLAWALRSRPGARVVWAGSGHEYPPLLRAGARVARCHDLELTEALLLGHAGRWGEPRAVAAAYARLTGAPVPPDPPPRPLAPPGQHQQESLFDLATQEPAVDPAAGPALLPALVAVHADQRARLGGDRRLTLLVAAESAAGLVAAEMGFTGLPWRADVHDALLRDLLGDPSPVGGPPRRLAELTARIADALGQRIHPDSPAEVIRAFSRLGISLPSTRAWVLRQVDHPAVPLLLQYKELYRLWVAHGWSWLEQWVRDGRFHAEYVPGGVVSGRWATRGGGALQIPKVVRRAVVADPGWVFVVADAGQLEPRILAAMSGDRRLGSAAAGGDLYAGLAAQAFGGDRAKAKVALLGAMYGQTGGSAAPALAALRQHYPAAWEYVEQAARTGESGGLVRSWLGRTCPPPSAGTGGDPAQTDSGPEPLLVPSGEEPGPGRGGSSARARGRFTRNFVIQATAAEWALVLLATLRTALHGSPAELVFFQHDEVIVHCPREQAPDVVRAVHTAAEQAGRLLFGDTPVRFPLGVATVDCYADAK